ncbi:Uncharacterized protein FKW44_001647 [Caligus rogercresseyi]|uniref:Reverse transcriptase/retrotransposon-derived protein RNase H-like domain-containing protein n=1 Tax=Caligus rogercresseyi TaxID=217165 RepID=A0A7T8KJ87_CALRO|nr:Uncharacterized protein FKW44_001647 [Caligus rogercresseyi]
MVNYYNRFIPGCGGIMTPLYALLRKDTPFIWTSQCASAFKTLQDALTHAITLQYPSADARLAILRMPQTSVLVLFWNTGSTTRGCPSPSSASP